MKMGNLKIGTRLTIGFMLVILLTAAVGGMALRQMSILAGLVNKMYDHPLTVGYCRIFMSIGCGLPRPTA